MSEERVNYGDGEKNVNVTEKRLLTNYEPMNKQKNVFNVVDCLLKSPGKIVYEIKNNSDDKMQMLLLFIFMVSICIFGFINGLFSGELQIVYSSLKYPVCVFLSSLICLPSLYIFLALSGLDIKFNEAMGFLFVAVSIASIILVGFTPILWIFSQSTDSVFFMGLLNIVFCLVAGNIGFSVLNKIVEFLSKNKREFVTVWIIIFYCVIFQMATVLRPLIGSSKAIITYEKKFFITHWAESTTKNK